MKTDANAAGSIWLQHLQQLLKGRREVPQNIQCFNHEDSALYSKAISPGQVTKWLEAITSPWQTQP